MKRVRNLSRGQRFMLLRTRETYVYLGASPITPSGHRHECWNESLGQRTTLHHSCHVKPIVRMA